MQMLLQLVISLATMGGVADEGVIVSNSAHEAFIEDVYSGADADMPYDSSFYLGLPPRAKGRPPPASIEEAFQEMKEMLPNWYLSALIKGKGEYECSVSVNGESYVAIIESALIVNWDMYNNKSSMRESLGRVGIKSDHPMVYMAVLSRGFCVYLKEGVDAGIEEIRRHSE